MLEWIRDKILKRKVIIHNDKTFQIKLGICGAGTLLKFATIQMTWNVMIVPSLTS
jgi:hypothetical protein